MDYVDLRRRDTAADARAWSECKRDYKLLRIDNEDAVLDLGAHIGCFLLLVSLKTGGRIRRLVAVEPSLDSYELLVQNSEIINLTGCYLLRSAVVADNYYGNEICLYERVGSETSHTILPTRGRMPVMVPAVPVGRLLETYSPTVVKVDIEGGEYDILDSISSYGSVSRIAVEYHFRGNRFRGVAANMHADIQKKGFSVIKPIRFDTGAWNQVTIYERY